MSTVHSQVLVKVNASVDKGIAGLVSALNRFPCLRTIESCEGQGEWSWVCFTCGTEENGRWAELAEFVLGFLGPRLAEELGDRVDLSLRVTPSGLCRAEMAVRKTAISATVSALRALKRRGVTAQLRP